MPLYLQDLEYNNEQFELDVCHAMRQVLTAMGVYHAPWIIEVRRTGLNVIDIRACWNPKNTFPTGKNVDLDMTHYAQQSVHPIEHLTDINLCALARALANRMRKRIKDKE